MINYKEIKKAQEKALADFAYYTGILTHAGGCANEHLAPEMDFHDADDCERLLPIWLHMLEEGYNRDKTGWDT
jgi:hypothetical protein